MSQHPPEPVRAAQLRISDADRHAVAEILREAAGEGRLDFDELDERLGQAYAAKTYGDLVPITADLPAARLPDPVTAAAPVSVAGGAPAHPGAPERHLAVLSGVERRGTWRVPGHTTVTCFMGGAQLDLREAVFTAPEVTITINAVMGGAEIVVGPEVEVVMGGVGIMGAFSGPRSGATPDEHGRVQRVVVNGFALMGGVEVKRKERGSRRFLGRDR